MQVRVKRGERNATRRMRRAAEIVERQSEGDDAPVAPPRSRPRTGPPPQDRAVYSCSCGFVFDEHVSTSVQCPHCGQTQAW
jgi:rubrerythrin